MTRDVRSSNLKSQFMTGGGINCFHPSADDSNTELVTNTIVDLKEFRMRGQMSWLSGNQSDPEKVLHLRTAPSKPWRPYTAYREYSVPDYNVPRGSKGWATYQKLMRAGWTLVASAQAHELSLSNHVELKV